MYLDDSLVDNNPKIRNIEGGISVAKHKTPTIVFGLGGFGVQVIEKILKFEEERGRSDNIRIQAFDTEANSKSPAVRNIEVMRFPPSMKVFLRERFIPNNDWFPSLDGEYKRFFDDVLGKDQDSIRAAQQTRVFGRFAFHYNFNSIYQKVFHAFQGFEGTKDRIDVFVAVGLAGGTGSGMFLDFLALVRHIAANLQLAAMEMHLIMTLGDIIYAQVGDAALKRVLDANSYAALKELNYFVQDTRQFRFEVKDAKQTIPLSKAESSPADYAHLLTYSNHKGFAYSSREEQAAMTAKFIVSLTNDNIMPSLRNIRNLEIDEKTGFKQFILSFGLGSLVIDVNEAPLFAAQRIFQSLLKEKLQNPEGEKTRGELFEKLQRVLSGVSSKLIGGVEKPILKNLSPLVSQKWILGLSIDRVDDNTLESLLRRMLADNDSSPAIRDYRNVIEKYLDRFARGDIGIVPLASEVKAQISEAKTILTEFMRNSVKSIGGLTQMKDFVDLTNVVYNNLVSNLDRALTEISTQKKDWNTRVDGYDAQLKELVNDSIDDLAFMVSKKGKQDRLNSVDQLLFALAKWTDFSLRESLIRKSIEWLHEQFDNVRISGDLIGSVNELLSKKELEIVNIASDEVTQITCEEHVFSKKMILEMVDRIMSRGVEMINDIMDGQKYRLEEIIKTIPDAIERNTWINSEIVIEELRRFYDSIHEVIRTRSTELNSILVEGFDQKEVENIFSLKELEKISEAFFTYTNLPTKTLTQLISDLPESVKVKLKKTGAYNNMEEWIDTGITKKPNLTRISMYVGLSSDQVLLNNMRENYESAIEERPLHVFNNLDVEKMRELNGKSSLTFVDQEKLYRTALAAGIIRKEKSYHYLAGENEPITKIVDGKKVWAKKYIVQLLNEDERLRDSVINGIRSLIKETEIARLTEIFFKKSRSGLTEVRDDIEVELFRKDLTDRGVNI